MSSEKPQLRPETLAAQGMGRIAEPYRDIVPPREALARTASWLTLNQPAPGGIEEVVLQDPFDYAAEDALVARYRSSLAGIAEPVWAKGEAPGYGLAFSGPGGRARSQATFES